jgi:hypothetical protein
MAPKTLARSRIHKAGWAHPYTNSLFSPVFYADGDPAVEPDDPEGEPDGGEPEDDWTPPTREEWEANQAKLKTASGEAAVRRKYLRAHGIDPKSGNKLNPDPEPEPEPEPEPAARKDEPRGASPAEVKRAVDRAAAEAELRGRRQTRALVTGVNSALAESGWNGQRLGSLMKLIDLDEVEIDDDGEIVGLAEQIDDIKREWPEFFKRTRAAGTSNSGGSSGQNGAPAAKVDAADKKPPKPEPKSWAEAVSQQIVRGG